MGQLEVYNINETILSGLIATVSNNYISESNESSTFESYKAYFYSSNKFVSKKLRKQCAALNSIAITNNNGIYKSSQFFYFSTDPVIKITKTIDDYSI
jgi:hypothetical protein